MKSRYPERRIAVCLILGMACFLVACQPRSPSPVITTASPEVAVGATSSPTVAPAQSVAISQPTPEVTPAAVQPHHRLFTPGKLVFTSNRSELAAQEPGDIFVSNADGSDLANLTRRPAMYEHPVWSPDGTQIAFVSNHEGRHQVYVIQADGSGEQVVPGTGPLDFIAGWSPDGQWLLIDREGPRRQQRSLCRTS